MAVRASTSVPVQLFDEPFQTHYFWMGPDESVTGLHSDDENNALVRRRRHGRADRHRRCLRALSQSVIWGQKRVVLAPPGDAPLLYINDKYDSGTQCCDGDPETFPDMQPLLKFALFSEVTLGPGDVLFVPMVCD